MNCRHCSTTLTHKFLDLGFAPPSNSYISTADLSKPEVFFPLRLFVCDVCWLVQTEDYASSHELFTSDYAYFSSVSKSWLDHAHRYVEAITERLGLGSDSFVIEVASNDGYLLKNFVERNIPCLGIEPTQSTADAAERIGVPTLKEFFGTDLAKQLADEGRSADLILGNNVYAHVPDINDFTRGLCTVLKAEGTVTLEFPHLMKLIEQVQFDTVYHEHFSYLSLHTVDQIFTKNGLKLYDVEQIPTHGGSLRVYGCRADSNRPVGDEVTRILRDEERAGLRDLAVYAEFQARADKVKNELLEFLLERKREGKSVVAYGAAAKGVTLLNYGGVRPDLLPFVCDAAPSKQGKFLPGCHIPIYSPDQLWSHRPDFVLILPWNIAAEVRQQLSDVSDWGGKFVTAVPEIVVTEA